MVGAAHTQVADLRGRRELLGLSRGALARLAGVGRETIRRIEEGAVAPRLGTRHRIARALAEAEAKEAGRGGTRPAAG